MFVYKAMTALADVGGSVSFALPDSKIHAVMSIVPQGRDTLLHLKMLGEGRALEADVHRALDMTEMKEFLRDERNETQVRFAIRTLWDRMEGRN